MSAATTLRWSDLLEHQGLNTADAVRNQAIVDIAPIAAPATAGTELEEVYPYFKDYVVQLLQLWLKGSPAGVPKPMIVFGRPVHSWIKQNFHIDLNVLDLGSLPVPLLGSVPIIAANHPSYIFYVVTRPGDSDA